jgi:hypothetical protein
VKPERLQALMDDQRLLDPRVNVRVVLAFLWVCHFILWIFGDMFTLLQEMGEPATDTAITYVAPTTAIVLTLIVVFCLMGRPAHVRRANLILAPVYLLLNIGRAYTWPKEAESRTTAELR